MAVVRAYSPWRDAMTYRAEFTSRQASAAPTAFCPMAVARRRNIIGKVGIASRSPAGASTGDVAPDAQSRQAWRVSRPGAQANQSRTENANSLLNPLPAIN